MCEKENETEEIKCCNCGDIIRAKPYIRHNKLYCPVCRGRAERGLLDEVVKQQYGGVRVFWWTHNVSKKTKNKRSCEIFSKAFSFFRIYVKVLAQE